MASAWEKIEATFKKMQPKIKKLDKAKAEKLLKLTKSALQTAWDDEENFIEALKAARESGLDGKKPADFMSDADFKKSFAALVKSAGQHTKAVKLLQASCVEAKPLGKPLTKLLADIKKDMIKGNKEHVKLQKEVMAVETSATEIANMVGKLTAPELFYGPQIVRVIDKIINKSKGGPKGDSAKLIEAKELAKNTKLAGKLTKDLIKICEPVPKLAAKDIKKALNALKLADEPFGKLEALDAAYQKVKKKDSKLIKAAKEKTKIEKSIKQISKELEKATGVLSEAQDVVHELTS